MTGFGVRGQPLGHIVLVHGQLLDLGNGQGRIQSLGAHFCTVHDRVTGVDLHVLLGQAAQPLGSRFVTRVRDPPVGLKKHSGSEVLLVTVPPVTRATRRTARAEDALVQTVESSPVGLGLELFGLGRTEGGGVVDLQPRLDRLVLLVKVAEIGDQVPHDWHVRQRVDLDLAVGDRLVDGFQTGQRVLAVDVHRTAATDTFAARSPEGKRSILFVLNLDEGVEDHGSALLDVNRIALYVRLVLFIA